MTTFDDRAKAFENKYAYEAYQQFRLQARRNKLMGRWAAAQMGLTGKDAEDYAAAVCKTGLAKSGDAAILRKISDDLARCNRTMSETDLTQRFERLKALAGRQLQREPLPSLLAL
jgi:hypothetical protein